MVTGMPEYEAAKAKCKSRREYGGCSGLNRVHCLNNDNVFFECFTNADRIRVMSNEELAEWIVTHDIEYGDCPPQHTFCDGGITQDDCRLCWLDWLKQEVDSETD